MTDLGPKRPRQFPSSESSFPCRLHPSRRTRRRYCPQDGRHSASPPDTIRATHVSLAIGTTLHPGCLLGRLKAPLQNSPLCCLQRQLFLRVRIPQSESPAQTWHYGLLGSHATPMSRRSRDDPLVCPTTIEQFQVPRSPVTWPKYQCSAPAAVVVPKTMHTNRRLRLCLVLSIWFHQVSDFL